MQLTTEQLAVLNHVVLDGQEWADHHGNEEWMLAKVAKYKQKYLDAKASLGADYKTRQEVDDATKKDEQDSYDNAPWDEKRRREYPNPHELLIALYDTEDKAAIDQRRADIKLKYPKA